MTCKGQSRLQSFSPSSSGGGKHPRSTPKSVCSLAHEVFSSATRGQNETEDTDRQTNKQTSTRERDREIPTNRDIPTKRQRDTHTYTEKRERKNNDNHIFSTTSDMLATYHPPAAVCHVHSRCTPVRRSTVTSVACCPLQHGALPPPWRAALTAALRYSPRVAARPAEARLASAAAAAARAPLQHAVPLPPLPRRAPCRGRGGEG